MLAVDVKPVIGCPYLTFHPLSACTVKIPIAMLNNDSNFRVSNLQAETGK